MKLDLRLVMEQSAIRKGRDIEVLVLLVNTSGVPMWVNSRLLVNKKTLPHEVAFRLIRGSVELAFRPKIRVDPLSEEFEQLEPGSVLGRRVRLNKYFQFEKGSYGLTAWYANNQDPLSGPPPAAWKGRIESPAVRFTIK